MIIHQPFQGNLGSYFINELSSRQYSRLSIACAYAKMSGISRIYQALSDFKDQGGEINLFIGIDQQNTTFEALNTLFNVADNLYVVHNQNYSHTFHHKIYMLDNHNSGPGWLAVGSNNLTGGGLFVNYESFSISEFEFNTPNEIENYQNSIKIFDYYVNNSEITKLVSDDSFISELLRQGYVVTEASSSTFSSISNTSANNSNNLFGSESFPMPRPSGNIPSTLLNTTGSVQAPDTDYELNQEIIQIQAGQNLLYPTFFMTLQRTDVGVGQQTAGTSRRSPEIFIPLAARNANPSFWEWPSSFKEDPSRPNKLDRSNVQMQLNNNIISVNMMTWPLKHDFRLRSEALRSSAQIGDIMVIRKVDLPDYAYDVIIIPASHSEYHLYFEKCSNAVRNSQKRWGYS